jgi:hypothetical protein
MNNYAVVNQQTNIIENVILWDGVSSWTSPENTYVILVPEGANVAVGWSCIDGVIIDPNMVE